MTPWFVRIVMVAGAVLASSGGMPTNFDGAPLVSGTYPHLPVAGSYGLGGSGADRSVGVGAAAVPSGLPRKAVAATTPPITTTTVAVVPMMALRRALRCRSA